MLSWIKKNKLSAFLILIIVGFLARNLFSVLFGISTLGLNIPSGSSYSRTETAASVSDIGLSPAGDIASSFQGLSLPSLTGSKVAPTAAEERMIVEETRLSMVVSDVGQSVDQMIRLAREAGGFMVNRSVTSPQEAPYATLTLRVPSDRLEETLSQFRQLAVKIPSENIRGIDVTAEYEDLEAKLATHYRTKVKFEEILDRSEKVQDLLTVQRELINIQNQIDVIKGRQKYLEQTAALAKITAHLSTDEWALPYTPAKPFRANVIFKEAVRSLILTLRGLAAKGIWLGVYSVIWLPVLVVILLVRRLVKKRKTPQT